jgi:5-guanidino-2-oxopentanoate decarboxylase
MPLDLLSKPAGPGWKARSTAARPAHRGDRHRGGNPMLKAARTPFIILGGGALDGGKAALAIAEALGAPILTTTAGKGAVPADHPLCWGYCLGNPAVQAMVQASDCVLAAGTELSETDFWTSDCILENLIRIDIDPASIGRPHTARLAILADAAPALAAIAAGVKGNTAPRHIVPSTEDHPLRATLRKVLTVIRDSLPPETVIASDMTQIAYAANEIFPVSQPRTWLHPVGFGTLGFALPAAIGAKFAVGEKPVAALLGDYGFQYTCNELGTAVEHKLPHAHPPLEQRGTGPDHDGMVGAGIQPNAVNLMNPDFQVFARAYGASAERPADLKSLARCIGKALKADGPTIIEMTPRMVAG